MTDENASSGAIRTIDRAIDLLMAVEKVGQPASLTDLSRETSIPKCTVLRLLSALERRGFVEKERSLYQLGPALVPLTRAFLRGSSLPRASLPILQQLALATDESAALWVRHGFERVIVQHVDSPNPLRLAAEFGQHLPVHLGASGQVLTAAMPEDDLEQLLTQVGQIRMADGRILRVDQYRQRLDQVRQQGYATSLGERLPGVLSIAAPVLRRGQGVVAAVSLSGPESRVRPEKTDQLVAVVMEAASQIADACGRF